GRRGEGGGGARRREQRLVEPVRPVRRADHDDAGGRIEAVHLGEDLVQSLLALVVAAAEAGRAGRARAADGVELVDEDDRLAGLLGLLEEVAYARGADADDRLDELRRGLGEEGDVRLAGDGPCEQRLARAGGPGEEDAVRDARAEAAVLVRLLEKVDHLRQLVLRLV